MDYISEEGVYLLYMEFLPHTVHEVKKVNELQSPGGFANAIITSEIEKRLIGQQLPDTVEIFGAPMKRRPESGVDAMVATIQSHKEAAHDVYEDAVKRGEFQLERAASRRFELEEAGSAYAVKFAEYLEHYPEDAERMAQQNPLLAAFVHIKTGYESTLQEKDGAHRFDISKDAGNDSHFKEAA